MSSAVSAFGLTAGRRALVVAPHPSDETFATTGIHDASTTFAPPTPLGGSLGWSYGESFVPYRMTY